MPSMEPARVLIRLLSVTVRRMSASTSRKQRVESRVRRWALPAQLMSSSETSSGASLARLAQAGWPPWPAAGEAAPDAAARPASAGRASAGGISAGRGGAPAAVPRAGSGWPGAGPAWLNGAGSGTPEVVSRISSCATRAESADSSLPSSSMRACCCWFSLVTTPSSSGSAPSGRGSRRRARSVGILEHGHHLVEHPEQEEGDPGDGQGAEESLFVGLHGVGPDGEGVVHEAGERGGEGLAADDHVPAHHEDAQ